MTDEEVMRHALAIGRRGLGRVAPWPSVGCVIVKGGRVVGRGVSDRATMRHAEVAALEQAGTAARGASAFVTLEPCSHHGTTPPCADALARAGIARVVSAMEDPNPLVAGEGHARLRGAGIEVSVGLCEARARRDHAGFLSVLARGRPWLTLKLASSLDGRIATASGESRWITGPQARRAVHAERLLNDAVMVGAGTARADDPALTVRGMGEVHQPARVVLSRRLDLDPASALGRTAREVPVWLVHGPEAAPARRAEWEGLGARLVEAPVEGGQIDPRAALRALGSAGITRVLCEGGGSLAASLLSAGLADELAVFSAGLALGAEGRPSLGAMGIGSLSEAPRFELIEARALGGDVLHRWRQSHDRLASSP